MATQYKLKPFVLNGSDLKFIFDQVTFTPLFDAQGNAVVAWNGNTPIYDSFGNLISTGGLSGQAAIDAFGQGYASVTAAQGIRDVTGNHNNLAGVHSGWGAADLPFVREVSANFTGYVTPLANGAPGAFYGNDTPGHTFAIDLNPYVPGDQNLATVGSNYTTTVNATANDGNANTVDTLTASGLYAHQLNVVDYTARMISLTVTTGGVTFALDGNGHIAHDADGQAIVTDYGVLQDLGHIDFQNPTSGEFFIGQENPGVAPTNSWFAIFGQFFDHGLDLIGKGGQGTTITIALATDDPLYGVLGPDNLPVTSITINRATIDGADANGDPNYVNHTSPFIDQSQTYGSSEQITNLLREWVSTDGNATYHAGMELFDGHTLADQWLRKYASDGPDGLLTDQTLPTLGELRDHVLDTNRAALTWEDVLDYRNRGTTGQLSGGNSGHALILDMNPRFDGDHLDSTRDIYGTSVDVLVDQAVATLAGATPPGFAFGRTGLDGTSGGIQLTVTGGAGGTQLPDGTYTGANALALWLNFSNFNITAPAGPVHDAVGQLLMAAVGDHYIAGDGRVNENFGLTTIHHVFHEEHNFQVANLIAAITAEDAAAGGVGHDVLHQWQTVTAFQDAGGNYTNGAGGPVAWDADKMFNAAKLVVEMEYQHAAVDQYARTITPRIQEFVGYSSGIDPSVSLDFSQAAFRFGHSTIRETIDTIDPSGWFMGEVRKYALEAAFLNPEAFATEGPAGIALGLAHQQMNEIDEFITPALNQGLLGQPLDLAAINIARGRDLGIPTLNEFRDKIGLTTYASWADFGANMIHPESLVNFIAAYSFDGDTARAQDIVDLADGVISVSAFGYTLDQAIAFLNNDSTTIVPGANGFNKIDTWLGGLAEAHVPGSLLGETFDTVFTAQIQSLMDGDRFYYLYRLVNQQFGEEVNNGQFKDIVERNTGLEHLNGSIFAYADKYYDFGRDSDSTTAGVQSNHAEHGYADLIAANAALNGSAGVGIFSDGGAGMASNGAIINIGGIAYIRDIRAELDPNLVHPVEGTPTSGADSHEVLVGTDAKDFIHARGGDDTIYGEGGDDQLFGDGGVDRLYGGDGDDVLDTGEGPDLADGGAGDDTIYGRGSGSEVGGFDQLVGGSGNDKIYGGEGIDKLSGGAGDDQIWGDANSGDPFTEPVLNNWNTDPFTHGGDGNDYIDGGGSGDNLYGDDGDDYVYGNDDQDIVSGGQGDDILRPGLPSSAAGGGPDEVLGGDGITDAGYGGKVGFDIMDLSDYVPSAAGETIDFITQNNPLVAIDGKTPFPAWTQVEGIVATQNNDIIIGDDVAVDVLDGKSATGNWLIGGSGNDTITGGGGNDVIVGDKIRLDTLIGTYSGGYGNTLADGTSHRAIGALSAGLLGTVNAAMGSTVFDKHFEEFLKTEIFKDFTLGDNGAAGAADTAVLRGNRSDYTVVGLDANGAVIEHPEDGLVPVFAVRITDKGGDRTLADGTIVPSDGTDLVMGVESFRFADKTLALNDLFNHRPTGTLSFNGAEGPSNVSNNNNAIRLSATNTLRDADNIGGNNTTGTISNINTSWRDAANVAFAVNKNNSPPVTTPYVDSQGRLVLHTTAGTIVNEVATYTDALGTAESVSKAWNLVVGTSNGDAALNGTASLTVSDVIYGLSGNDTLNGNAGDDRLYGGSANDNLNGGDGADLLDGGSNNNNGGDVMTGGAGDDTYVIDDVSINAADRDSVVEAAGAAGGIDTVTGGVSLNLANYANVENVTLTGNGDNYATGNALDNVLTGNSGDNTLNGVSGLDTAAFNGAAASAAIALRGNTNVLTVSTQNGGTDTLQNIDTIRFGSSNYALVQGTSAANAGLTGGADADLIVGGQGNDTIAGNGGDDVIVWTATGSNNGNAVLDGRDIVDGGANGTAGDTFVVNGNSQGETFRVYSRAAWLAVAGNLPASLAATTEIVVTRNGTNNASVIAELKSIEELQINTGGGNDNVQAIGNFDPTSLNFNTITIEGASGDDTVDISGLQSEHRIVFKSNGGHDTILGTLRTQDVIELPVGLTKEDYVFATDGSGLTTMTHGADTISFTGGQPQFETDDNEIEDSSDGGSNPDPIATDDIIVGTSRHDVLDGGAGSDGIWGRNGNDCFIGHDGDGNDRYYGNTGRDSYDASAATTGLTINLTGTWATGGMGDDRLVSIENAVGGSGDDVIIGNREANILAGGGGNDRLLGLAGKDRLYGNDGNDIMNGGGGGDRLYGGGGDDALYVGKGNDTIVLNTNFGNDVVIGFDAQKAGGQDFIDVRELGITAANFAANVSITHDGADTLVTIGTDGTLRLVGVDWHDVNRADFHVS